MDSVLLVSRSEKGRSYLSDLMKSSQFTKIATAGSGSEARRVLAQSGFDLVIINAPLPDEFGHELSIFATEESLSGVVIIVETDIADEVSHKVEEYGVLVVEKPMSRPVFFQAIKLAVASQRRMRGLHDENAKLQKKIEEIRLVDRAKCLLIACEQMSETQAHRYLEKKAMDMRVTRREVAVQILKKYDQK